MNIADSKHHQCISCISGECSLSLLQNQLALSYYYYICLLAWHLLRQTLTCTSRPLSDVGAPRLGFHYSSAVVVFDLIFFGTFFFLVFGIILNTVFWALLRWNQVSITLFNILNYWWLLNHHVCLPKLQDLNL